ncbi:MAG: hypothetical protein HKN21_07625 [Candidatus Eisenbacteria bacterium]|uniref:Dockerin domain-containing protein n=1 Tax=Eiseniibacteriota bacterium TaxID=2212470 RepID=A0A7Y2E7F2_UNCEI|nr:hypothetical protein [Candidatus Eisenbacteria bacterium]
MGRSSRLLLAAIMVGALTASVSFAGIPDPALSTVPNVLVSPDGSLEYKVTVVGADGPIDTALVQIVVGAEADGLICWCVGQTHPTIEATTDASGCASFFISAGGCIDSSLVASPPAVEVFANGIKIGEPGIVSPDAVDANGDVTQTPWVIGANCDVALGDAVYHTPFIAGGLPNFCSDMDSDGAVTLADAVTLTAPISNGASCSN